MKKVIGLLALLLLLPIASAARSLPLLAVSEASDGFIGALANVTLELKKGSGNIFIATYPLTKIDTQISTRMAKEIACSRSRVDCSQYDFFYTIRAESPIIGGPSAGAAIAILTLAELEKLEVQESIAITGTINSGGFIGPVGGIIEKIDAAAEHGIQRVLIPKGEIVSSLNGKNVTDVVAYGKERGVIIQEVFELDEAAAVLAGRAYEQVSGELQEDAVYTTTMKSLAADLCNRSRGYQQMLAGTKEKSPADDLVEEASLHIGNKRYYTAASLCFGANAQYREQQLNEQQLSAKELVNLILQTRANSKALDKKLAEIPITRITDLETLMISKERIQEADAWIDLSERQAIANDWEGSRKSLAFAMERLYTVVLWSRFFNASGKELMLNNEIVQAACLERLIEAQERIEYVQLNFPEALESTSQKLMSAAEARDAGQFSLCLFEASKVKAEANNILSIQSNEQDIAVTLSQRLEIIRKSLVRAQAAGLFPIMGYSYYEYAQALRETDPYAAHLYAEYALELGNLEVYFEQKQHQGTGISNLVETAALLLIGLAIGATVGMRINPRRTVRRRPRKGKRGDYKPGKGLKQTLPGKKR